MRRRTSFLAQAALLGTLAALAFPGEGLALRPIFYISLTPSGPSPAVFSTPAGLGTIAFQNTDSVTHTIAFANGWCSAEIPAGGHAFCGFLPYVGDYTYTVDGTTQADVVAEAVGRSVSLAARAHSVKHGSAVTLHGTLDEENAHWSPPGPGSPQPIVVIARGHGGHPGCRIGIAQATVHRPTKSDPFYGLRWHLRIRPRVGMTYVAIANYQPAGGRVWERALSKPFRVGVRR